MFKKIADRLSQLTKPRTEQDSARGQADHILQSLFEQDLISVVVIEPQNGRWLRFNERACGILGYSRQEFSGKSWQDFIHPDDLYKRLVELEKLQRSEIDALTHVSRYLHKDGSIRYLRINTFCSRRADGQPDCYIATGSDITEQMRSEQAFALHTGLLEKMARIAQIGAWSLDVQAGKLSWSPEVYRIHGLDPSLPVQIDQAIGFYAPEAQADIQRAVDRCIATGTPWDLELPLINAAGVRLWVRAQGEAVLKDDRVTMIHGAFQDITARKQRDEDLQAALSLQESMLSNTTVGMMQLAHRRMISCNRRMEEMFGYAPGELVGQPIRKLYFSDKEYEEAGAKILATLPINNSYTDETFLCRIDGSRIRVLISGCANDRADPKAGTTWCFIDVSEAWEARRQAQRMLKAVENSPVSIVITNAEAVVEYVNPAFCASSGYSAAELLGNNPRVLKSGKMSDDTYKEMWQTLKTGKNWQGTLLNRRKNGELYWESVSISPISDESGVVTHYLGIKEDITKRIQMIEQIERYRAHLEDTVRERTAELSTALEAALVADRTKDEFLANVSHEMRTPLNVVIGLSDLARRATRDEKLGDYLDKIAGAGRNLAAIINDLLDLSKIVAGHLEFEQIVFNPRELASRSHAALLHKAEEKGLKLFQEVDAKVPAQAVGDPMRIEQIVLNLLNNAIKFTPNGEIRLRITCLAEESLRICLGIEVEDSGIGISEADREKLFQPFFQADASISRQYGGTGLGLHICKRLAEMMDGSISVSPRSGGGSIFRVRLWLKKQQGVVSTQESTQRQFEAEPVHYRNVQILAVDDQPTNLEIVAELLLAVGIKPVLASNGQEALDLLKASGRTHFDLVLMDIQMPVLDGLSTTRTLRQWPEFADLPVIALTAHTMEHEKRNSLAAGINDHIGKPFEVPQFYDTIAKWIPRIKQQALEAPEQATQTTSAFPAIPGVDTVAGLARFAGNSERYRHWLQIFVSDAPQLLAQFSTHHTKEGNAAASRIAHAMRGRAGMLGAGTVQAAAAALEQALENNQDINPHWQVLQQSVRDLCHDIASTLNTPDASS